MRGSYFKYTYIKMYLQARLFDSRWWEASGRTGMVLSGHFIDAQGLKSMLFGNNLNGVHYFVLGCIFINKLFKNLSALKGSYVIAHHPTPLPTCESMVHFHWILILVFINLVLPFAKFLPIYRIAQCQVKNWHVYNHETTLGL